MSKEVEIIKSQPNITFEDENYKTWNKKFTMIQQHIWAEETIRKLEEKVIESIQLENWKKKKIEKKII